MFPGGALLRTPTVDNEGHLVSPSEWTEDWARETAETMGVALTVEHWE
ncbi:TusE/DsrC/DsvC family sulfur relay protein, partial [Roseiarcus sp.]